MRVLLISAYFPIKRTDFVSSFVRDEARELVRKGVDVHVAFWKYAGRLFRSRDFIVDGIKVHGLKLFSPVDVCSGFSNLLKLPFYSFSLKEIVRTGFFLSRSKQVEKIVKRYDIDLIHAHFAHPEGFVGLFAKCSTNKPLVISVWGYDVQSDPKSGYGALSQRDTAYLVKRALMAADAIIAGAESHYKMAIHLIDKEKSDKIHFIPPGIDTVSFNPNVDGSNVRKKLSIRADQPVVLFARHLKPIYGTEYLIKAVPYIVKNCPNAIFLVLGEGSLLADLQQLARDLNVANHVKFLGQAPKTNMPLYHAASDIFVDPCIFGQGYASVEALLCGKPVIGFKMGQIRVNDEVDGYLVEPFSVKDLAERITQLIKHPAMRQEMGLKGRKRILDEGHGLQNKALKLIEIYDMLLKN